MKYWNIDTFDYGDIGILRYCNIEILCYWIEVGGFKKLWKTEIEILLLTFRILMMEILKLLYQSILNMYPKFCT